MRQFKKFALLAALALGGTSLAITTSTSTDFNNAFMDLTATGTAEAAVSFEVPGTSITIPKSQVYPGNTFKVTIPVTNNTDRSITVGVTEMKSGDLSGKLTITPSVDSITLAPSASGELIYTFAFAPAADGDQAIAGQSFKVDFRLDAVGTYQTSQDQRF